MKSFLLKSIYLILPISNFKSFRQLFSLYVLDLFFRSQFLLSTWKSTPLSWTTMNSVKTYTVVYFYMDKLTQWFIFVWTLPKDLIFFLIVPILQPFILHLIWSHIIYDYFSLLERTKVNKQQLNFLYKDIFPWPKHFKNKVKNKFMVNTLNWDRFGFEFCFYLFHVIKYKLHYRSNYN